MRNNILLISTLALLVLFVVGCGTYESISTAIVEATQNTIIQEKSSLENIKVVKNIDELVYASENHVDLEQITLGKGDTLSLLLASNKDSYFSLGNEEFIVKKDGSELMKFKFENAGEYYLECLFNCDQGDLAREMLIVVE